MQTKQTDQTAPGKPDNCPTCGIEAHKPDESGKYGFGSLRYCPDCEKEWETAPGIAREILTNKEVEVFELLWDSLKRDPEHKDRRQTGWGTKTKVGLMACLDRIYYGQES